MRRVTQRIVRVNDIGLSLHFLSLPKKDRELRSEEVIQTAFNTMKMTADLNSKAKTTVTLLERSLTVLEQEENYEECQIIKELIEAIPRVCKRIKSQAAQTSDECAD